MTGGGYRLLARARTCFREGHPPPVGVTVHVGKLIDFVQAASTLIFARPVVVSFHTFLFTPGYLLSSLFVVFQIYLQSTCAALTSFENGQAAQLGELKLMSRQSFLRLNT